jgi:hypothetical protein
MHTQFTPMQLSPVLNKVMVQERTVKKRPQTLNIREPYKLEPNLTIPTFESGVLLSTQASIATNLRDGTYADSYIKIIIENAIADELELDHLGRYTKVKPNGYCNAHMSFDCGYEFQEDEYESGTQSIPHLTIQSVEPIFLGLEASRLPTDYQYLWGLTICRLINSFEYLITDIECAFHDLEVPNEWLNKSSFSEFAQNQYWLDIYPEIAEMMYLNEDREFDEDDLCGYERIEQLIELEKYEPFIKGLSTSGAKDEFDLLLSQTTDLKKREFFNRVNLVLQFIEKSGEQLKSIEQNIDFLTVAEQYHLRESVVLIISDDEITHNDVQGFYEYHLNDPKPCAVNIAINEASNLKDWVFHYFSILQQIDCLCDILESFKGA